MRLLRLALLPGLVFVTGACVLVIEVVAMRVLSPYFGNTIFTVSSVLSVVLAGLSVGYWAGGRLADRFPSFTWFFGLIAASGASVMVLHWLGVGILPAYGAVLSLRAGPLVMALLLFFTPAVLLGTLSPYAVVLQKIVQPETGVGSVAGTMFFWSTLGSIAGSLLAGFVLVPHVGVAKTIVGDGMLLTMMGLSGIAYSSVRWRIAAIIGLVVVVASIWLIQPDDAQALYSKDGIYEKITIYDSVYAGKPARFFLQDRSLSGAMFLDSDPSRLGRSEADELAFDYTKYYEFYKPFTSLRRALVIGGGAYSIPKALLVDAPEADIDVVEIEPSLPQLAREYFNTPDSPRLHTHIEDGRRFLSDSDQEYDLIFSDVYYSFYSIPTHFTTKEFFETARSRLAPDGVLILNLIGSLVPEEQSFLFSELRTIQEVFPEMYVFAVQSPDVATPQNIIVVAVNRDTAGAAPDFPPLDGLGDVSGHLVRLGRYDLSHYPLFTDDYAPVDYLVGKMLSREYPTVLPFVGEWDGERALENIERQVSFGSRARGTTGHAVAKAFIMGELTRAGLSPELQSGAVITHGGEHDITNIIGRYRPEEERRIIIGTHYDAILRAYRDQENPEAPMPGANNSASGVAVLLETARALSEASPLPFGVDFVFFDGEEGVGAMGGGETVPWIPLGSTYFAAHLSDLYGARPEKAVVLDMVCDKDLQLYPEVLSLRANEEEVRKFWDIGSTAAPRSFLWSGPRRAIGDDHQPLLSAGIPSFLVIDFDYEPWFNTTEDTLDKCSVESLKAVGETLMRYLHAS